MKLAVTLLFCAFLLYSTVMKAQNLSPGPQAQGYVDSKNITVDYSTGIFHYEVPLFTFSSGRFKLPISLEYVAKGVRADAMKGLLGINWLLNTGGVVTRTIRGGIADESLDGGYLWAEKRNANLPLRDQIDKVNRHELDGESDVFTAMFNGKIVHFILRMDVNNWIYAEPLEWTNVQIECESADGQSITGWVVTDDTGTRYIYRQKEWSSDIIQEEAISFNGIRGKSYVSSWHLNRIEPMNSKPIVFHYLEDVQENSQNQKNVALTHYSINYRSKYFYGKNIRKRTFDFSKYSSEFHSAITDAKNYLQGFSMEMQLNTALHQYIGANEWIHNPYFNTSLEAIEGNFRVMGMIANFDKIGKASNELIQILNQLISIYEKQSSHNAQMAVACFGRAKNCVIKSLEEIDNQIMTAETYSGTLYTVKSPLLRYIESGDKWMEFVYVSNGVDNILSKILVENILHQVETQISLEVYDNLNVLSFQDKDGKEYNRLRFDYYEQPEKYEIFPDVWGFPRRRFETENEEFLWYADNECAKIGSLKTVTFPNGGKIEVDYECNSFRLQNDFGGIRIKSLVMEDRQSNTHDTIFYRYPRLGVPVFMDCTNSDVVKYGSFSDKLTHTRADFKGLMLVNTGNNGLYYPYVQKIMPGKGTEAYLFSTHDSSKDIYPYAFWLSGLPLAIARYDDDGNLKQMVKYKYFTDNTGEYASYFFPIDTNLNYKKMLPQINAYAYYMNEAYLSRYYREQQRIFLYEDKGLRHYMDPYKEEYLPNIQPRTSVFLPQQTYKLYYGGKTLVKEENVYYFAGHVTDSISISDFQREFLGHPYQKTEYFYDNPKRSCYPTRVVRTDSKGDRYTMVIKRITEMSDDADVTFALLKQRNLLSPIVKQVGLKGDTVLSEKVSVYKAFRRGDTLCAGVAHEYGYFPQSVETRPLSELGTMDNLLFTEDKAKYKWEQSVNYKYVGQFYLPEYVENNVEKKVYCYVHDRLILTSFYVDSAMVAAADFTRYKEINTARSDMDLAFRFRSFFLKFHNGCLEVDSMQHTAEFLNYRKSFHHTLIRDYIKMAGTERFIDSLEYRLYLDSLYVQQGIHVKEFCDQYRNFLSGFPEKRHLNDLVIEFYRLFQQQIIKDKGVLKYRELYEKSEYLSFLGDVKVTRFPESKHLQLYILSDGKGGDVYYKITDSGKVSSKTLTLQPTAGYSVQCFDIDLSFCKDVTALQIERESNSVLYLALVPAGISFEAISYYLDGKVFVTFNQSGEMLLREYDTIGRLIRETDGFGNVLKSYQYNTVFKNR